MKLKTLIGTDAFWIPPRLWSYAAENQIDGDFSTYSSEVLCEILGCSKHASSMLQALHDSGFMEKGKIKDWEFHNEFHAINSDRARKAALARHDSKRKEPKEKKENTETETEQAGYRASSKHAPSINEPKNDQFESFWMVYPKKRGKGKARLAFDKAMKMVSLEEILLAIGKLVVSPDWIKEGGKYVPHPSSWLNSEGWHDQVEMTLMPKMTSDGVQVSSRSSWGSNI